MSGLGGRGGLAGRILEGAQTALGQLAQFFRLPGYAALEPPTTPQPGRPRLTTPEQIAQALIARQLAPPSTGRRRFNAFYVCVATAVGSDVVLARITHDIEYDEGTARQTIYSRARAYAQRQLAQRINPSDWFDPDIDPAEHTIKWSCRLIRTTEITI